MYGKNYNLRILAVSFWSCISFIGMGASLVVFAPTLLDIAQKLNVGVGVMSVIFLVRAIGGVVGTIGSGILMDHFPKKQYSMLCCALLGRITATAVIPVSVNVVMLCVVMFLMGVTFGGLNNGVHVLLMKLWGHKSGPCLQFLHAAFSIGAFIAPLIAKPFIQDSSDAVDDYDTLFNTSNHTMSLDNPTSSRFGWAYWISASLFIFPLLMFIYFTVNRESTKEHKCEDEQALVDEDSIGKNTTIDPKTYKYPALVILFFFMLCYIGSEVSYGSLLFTYAVEGKLQFEKQEAANITAVFWGLFAFTRLFSVSLALLKVKTTTMISMNISGSVLAVMIFINFPHNHIVIWIVSALLGASFASIYPTTITWLSEHLPVTGKTTAVIVSGGNLGDILVPSVIAALVGNVNTDSFVYCIFSLIVISTVLIAVLFIMTAIYQRKHNSCKKEFTMYHPLPELVDSSIFEDKQ